MLIKTITTATCFDLKGNGAHSDTQNNEVPLIANEIVKFKYNTLPSAEATIYIHTTANYQNKIFSHMPRVSLKSHAQSTISTLPLK
jgi:hypothetical protein